MSSLVDRQQSSPAPLAPENENLTRTVWTLAWPAVALNGLQTLNILIDRYFLGHLPKDALIAHGGSMSVMFLFFSLAMALSAAPTALVSRNFGAQDMAQCREANRQSLNLSLLAGIAMMLVGLVLTPLFPLMFVPADAPEARHQAVLFLLAYMTGLPAVYITQSLAASLRGIGDTRSPMVLSGIQIALHVAFNLFFIHREHTYFGVTIHGLGWGLWGAAVGFSLSAWIAGIGYWIYTRRTPLQTPLRLALPTRDWVRRILNIASPAAVMAVLRVGSFMAFTIALRYSPNGDTALAAVSVGVAIESIMFMPAFGLSVSAAALVGQSLGMRRPDRAERVGWIAGHHGAIVVALLSVPIFIWAEPFAISLVGSGKPEVVAETVMLLRTIIVTEVLFSYAMIMQGAMQGAGDTKGPMWVSIGSLWFLRVPLAFLLALGFGMGGFGAWIAMSASQAAMGLLSIWLFKRGAWKLKEV